MNPENMLVLTWDFQFDANSVQTGLTNKNSVNFNDNIDISEWRLPE